MNSFLLPELFEYHRALPESVRQQARQPYALFQQDPNHPGLGFRQVHPTRPIFSARVGLQYRAFGVREGGDLFRFWIGTHAEYDRLLSQL
ncbi:MAG: hypothetical protein U0790_08355 [Isosphaeraceae bacterium]